MIASLRRTMEHHTELTDHDDVLPRQGCALPEVRG
jgi:hypothetical protein